MKPLATFDCLALLPDPEPRGTSLRIHNALPKARLVLASDRDAQRTALEAMDGAYVLVLQPNVLPNSQLASTIPDPVLVTEDYTVTWLARNLVTGHCEGFAGPTLYLRETLIADYERKAASPVKHAIMPYTVADWAFNYASRPAFSAAFDYAKQLLTLPNSAKEMTIAASFGSDMPYADWWHLGFLCGLSDATEAVLSYEQEKRAMGRGAKMQDLLKDLRRKSNAEIGLISDRISTENAAFFRRNRVIKPDPAVYAELAATYDKLGKAGQAMAAQWREASRWIWGEPTR
jgi:hypothetical protein